MLGARVFLCFGFLWITQLLPQVLSGDSSEQLVDIRVLLLRNCFQPKLDLFSMELGIAANDDGIKACYIQIHEHDMLTFCCGLRQD